jgi:hypothetical protein
MARILVLILTLFALTGGLAADALAQPKVTITGLIDTITSWSDNVAIVGAQSLFSDATDDEWYARNRIRTEVTGQVGKAKGVLGLEFDHTFGQTGATDGSFGAGGQRVGTRGAFDLNTDVAGTIELKWGYIEFPIPFNIPTVARLGAQPFATTYKLAALASGDFAGANFVTTFTPTVKWHVTYVMIEENLTGARFGFGRADDHAVITSVEVTPFKGLDLRPTYAWFHSDGSTSSATANRPAGTPTIRATDTEFRHTIGIDARWRSGPFSLDPTFFYQFGEREGIVAGAKRTADIRAWFVDVIGGWRKGPLLVEVRGVYTTGNKSTDDLSRDVDYYQLINADSTYFAGGWGEIFPLGIDYFNGAFSTLGTQIGLDRYGRIGAAARATYSVTPDFDIRGVVSALWTAEKVDTDGVANYFTPSPPGGRGDSRYAGTEVNLGIVWRFAPGLAFDLVGAHLFAGSALDNTPAGQGSAKDVTTVASRIRFSF